MCEEKFSLFSPMAQIHEILTVKICSGRNLAQEHVRDII